jgi:hypothetical protein
MLQWYNEHPFKGKAERDPVTTTIGDVTVEAEGRANVVTRQRNESIVTRGWKTQGTESTSEPMMALWPCLHFDSIQVVLISSFLPPKL